MTSLARLAVVLSTPVLLLACAQGAPPLGGDGIDAGSGKSGANGYGSGDSGIADGGKALGGKDAGGGGGATGIDSGTSGGGTGGGGTGGGSSADFCTGTTSSGSSKNYDQQCDHDAHVDTTGSDFECASNDDCTANFGAGTCCYKPASSSICYEDYSSVGSNPQCVIE